MYNTFYLIILLKMGIYKPRKGEQLHKETQACAFLSLSDFHLPRFISSIF